MCRQTYIHRRMNMANPIVRISTTVSADTAKALSLMRQGGRTQQSIIEDGIRHEAEQSGLEYCENCGWVYAKDIASTDTEGVQFCKACV
jgi:hypothetical protein